MAKFLVPGVVSAVAGAIVGTVAVVGITAGLSENSRPEVNRDGNAQSSILNSVEYGER
ncbi:MAG: DUF2613 domain-containing protein [Rhodococcus sp.]|nr:DUF2613 domain-containing protein [Rhodococcus sp. (in: high G+C Gram-positive bacteria)]